MKKMPERPKQHQLETASRKKFESLIPDCWVVRRHAPDDYGIDTEVEIFDKNNQATGLRFYVQLKSSEKADKSKRRRVALKMTTLRYFLASQIPVLIVLYDAVEDTFFCRWAGHIDIDPRKKTRTCSFAFTEFEVLTKSGFLEIERAVKVSHKFQSREAIQELVAKIDVDVKDDIASTKLRSAVRRHLSQKSGGLISMTVGDEFDICLVVRDKTFRVVIGTRRCISVGYDKKVANLDWEDQLSLIVLVVVALSLNRVGRHDLTARLILALDNFLLYKIPEMMAVAVIHALLEAAHYDEAFAIIDKVPMELTFSSGFDFVVIGLATHKLPPNKIEVLVNYFKKRIEWVRTHGDDLSIGAAYYSLANRYRANGNHRLAIRNYRMALSFAPSYAKKDYYHAEMGGVFFVAGKYKCAEKAYGIAWKLNKAANTGLLYADAMMMAGNYKKAYNMFSKFLTKTEKPNSEWVLKSLILDRLVNKKGIKKQSRKIYEARSQKFFASGTNRGKEETISYYHKTIQMDALDALASFNYAKSLVEGREDFDHHDYQEAYLGFLTAAIICTNDYESWANCIIVCLRAHELVHVQLVLDTGYFYGGDAFLEGVSGWLRASVRTDKGNEIATEFINIIEEYIDKSKKRLPQKDLTLRFFDTSGEVAHVENFSPK